MKYKEFKEKLKNYPYFTSALFNSITKNQKMLLVQMNHWIEKGLVLRLKKGIYTLNDEDRKVGLSKMLTANILYFPSYISLEYMLSMYDMIPEGVFSVTSVSSKKTKTFSNPRGTFIYKSIKPVAFTGFTKMKDEYGFDCLVATPEKALLDYLYYNVKENTKVTEDYFEESLRLQNEELLSFENLTELARVMKKKKLISVIKTLKKWMET